MVVRGAARVVVPWDGALSRLCDLAIAGKVRARSGACQSASPAEPAAGRARHAVQMRLLLAAALVVAGCGGGGASPSTSPAPAPLGIVDLKFRVFDAVGRPWYCDPDFFPVARADEKELARQRLP